MKFTFLLVTLLGFLIVDTHRVNKKSTDKGKLDSSHVRSLPEPYHSTKKIFELVRDLETKCKKPDFFKVNWMKDADVHLIKEIKHGKSDDLFDKIYKKVSEIQNLEESTDLDKPEISSNTKNHMRPNLSHLWHQFEEAEMIPVVSVSVPSKGDTQKEEAMVVCGEHGREIITSEIGFNLLQTIFNAVCDPEETNKFEESDFDTFLELSTIKEVEYENSSPYSTAQILGLLSKWDLTIIPVVTPSARIIAEQENVCSRKNQNGVDVNRNYPFHFGEHGSDKESDEYAGNTPLSEPETRILASTLERVHPKLFLSIHSGVQKILSSPAYRAMEESSLPETIQKVMRDVKKQSCPSCDAGPASQLLSYLAYGCSMDYAFEKSFDEKSNKDHFSFTYETFGGDSSQDVKISPKYHSFEKFYSELGQGEKHCFHRFNPFPDQYESVVQTWTKGIFSTMDAVDKDTRIVENQKKHKHDDSADHDILSSDTSSNTHHHDKTHKKETIIEDEITSPVQKKIQPNLKHQSHFKTTKLKISKFH
eukprot:c30523_g1_i1.p1 GENE.c30523_g1_i1~~c30523_g1_i1.p1  ORF type:complete len:534 (+),score=156.20 c30523_g1_i1:50-1651(+)